MVLLMVDMVMFMGLFVCVNGGKVLVINIVVILWGWNCLLVIFIFNCFNILDMIFLVKGELCSLLFVLFRLIIRLYLMRLLVCILLNFIKFLSWIGVVFVKDFDRNIVVII